VHPRRLVVDLEVLALVLLSRFSGGLALIFTDGACALVVVDELEIIG